MKVTMDSSFQNVELFLSARGVCRGPWCRGHAEPPVPQGYIWQSHASLAADFYSPESRFSPLKLSYFLYFILS